MSSNKHPNATRAAEAGKTAQKTETAKQVAEASKPKEPKVDAKLAMVITVVADKNPKRENSASHARFAMYKTGMTGLAYVEACVAKNQLRRAARADLDWDLKHKFIDLKPAS